VPRVEYDAGSNVTLLFLKFWLYLSMASSFTGPRNPDVSMVSNRCGISAQPRMIIVASHLTTTLVEVREVDAGLLPIMLSSHNFESPKKVF
jgi:hypothetical protein